VELHFGEGHGEQLHTGGTSVAEYIFGSAATAFVTHPLCVGHGAIPDEVDDPSLRHKLVRQTPENPHRLEVLCGDTGVLRSDSFRELRWVNDPLPAPLADILRVHDCGYVHKLKEKAKEAHLQEPADLFRKLPLDGGDTKITHGSWDAALRACGAVLQAVDMVCNEQTRNAFCAVRPPGHHLGPAGACNGKDLEDDPEGSQGFCLLNNVAVGAAYARCVYRHIIRKVAIVDFDVHHGNGTEAIVRHLGWKHLEGTSLIKMGGFCATMMFPGLVTCKTWLEPESDTESVFFASIHGYGGGFYPGTGADCNQALPKIINVALRPDSSSADFREGLRTRILPELQAFAPDMIFISAGFDGHEDDLIGQCRCTEEDFIWITRQLMAVANRCCQGRLVSVLEGGYNTRAETLSPFAQCVAGHVRTLMHTSPNYTYLEAEAAQQSEGLRTETLCEADQRWVESRAEARMGRKRRRISPNSEVDTMHIEGIATASAREAAAGMEEVAVSATSVTAETIIATADEADVFGSNGEEVGGSEAGADSNLAEATKSIALPAGAKECEG